jgi:cyclopropane fatty-acyl-phospholipid synthase-like methyltransferase
MTFSSNRPADPVSHNVNMYNKHVNTYMHKFMDLNFYKDGFDLFAQMLPPSASVLELGCGPGNVIKYLSAQRADLRFLGVDLAEEMITAAQAHHPDAAFRILDIRHADSLNECFDAIVAAFCIPYLFHSDLPKLFADLSQLTHRNSLIYLSCMEGVTEKSGFEKTSFTGDDEIYITYYCREEIAELMHQYGFRITNFFTKDYPEMDGTVTTDLFYIAAKC